MTPASGLARRESLCDPIRLQVFLVVLLIIISLLALMLGPMSIHPHTILRIILGRFIPLQATWPATLESVIMETEIPIGILTALVGAPVFAYLLRKNKSGW